MMFGPQAVHAIRNAPTTSRVPPRDPWRTLLAFMAIAVVVASVALPISQVASLLIALLAFAMATVAGRPWIGYWRGCLWNRRERTRAELAALTGNAVFQRNIQALEEFRRQVGSGSLKAYAVSLSGGVTLLSGKNLACFIADQGRILLVSGNRNDWLSIPARPIPQGDIWIDLGGAVARSQITARSLIDEVDEVRYQQRVAWIREQAHKRGQGTGPLTSGLAIIEAMRHPDFRDMPLTKAMSIIRAVRKGPAASESIINKMHLGNYPEFVTCCTSGSPPNCVPP